MNKLSIESRVARDRKAGFTLIELLMVMSVIPILIMTIAVTMTLYPRKYAELEQDRIMTEQARNALGYMGRDIRSAPAVLKSAGMYTTSRSGTLVLAATSGGARVIVWTRQDGALVRFEFAGGDAQRELSRTIFAPQTVALMFDFDAEGPNISSLRVSITLSRKIMDQARNVTLGGYFSLRGKSK